MTLIWMEIVKEIYSKDKLITINKLSRKFLFLLVKRSRKNGFLRAFERNKGWNWK